MSLAAGGTVAADPAWRQNQLVLDFRIVQAAERLTRTEFSLRTEYVEHQVDIGVYTCPHCRCQLQFQTSDFERHEVTRYSNLDQSLHAAMERVRPLRAEHWESFLDFSCPGCGAPVRFIYEATGEWVMGSHGWRVAEIVEAAEPSG